MSTGGNPASSARRILVVRLGAMGDIIHALPAVASLKSSYPDAHLTWVVETRWAPLLEANPFIDRLLLLDRRSSFGWLRLWRELRAQSYDFAVDFQGLIKSALVARAAEPERISGFHPSQAREPLCAVFYSHKVLVQSSHVVDRNLELASSAGAAALLPVFPLPPGRPEGSLPSGEFVLACPLSGWRAK